jgi:hypothetical protein
MSLTDAVSAVRKIEAQYRGAKVDRVIGAKIIGYSSLSGPANKALAALAQYGLVERAGKGEMRVTSRARAILHPDSEGEKQQELRAAAFEPTLFRELHDRWPDMIPPEDGVASYLNRKGFNQSAIRPATKAYLNTLLALEEAGASESHGTGSAADPESPATETQEDRMHYTTTPPAVSPTPTVERRSEPEGELNEITMNIRGETVFLSGLLDRDGLLDLENKLKALKMLLGIAG